METQEVQDKTVTPETENPELQEDEENPGGVGCIGDCVLTGEGGASSGIMKRQQRFPDESM